MATVSSGTSVEFLSLPAEIRLQIYRYLTPVHGYMSDYQGIISCRQIKAELEKEVMRLMSTVLDNVAREWFESSDISMQISKPSSLPELSEITLSIPLADFDSRTGVPYPKAHLSKAHISLKDFHVQRLTIYLYGDNRDQRLERWGRQPRVLHYVFCGGIQA
ncbi:hypothetical protein BU26DRAFT_567596 [Trematosphaeria pertusa]|uniref:Uncharacterized protein n=1 Tax=Trematosphaeria pertusa TaxID=390896 RepID=A0A6A6I6C5_9PLEO|nr:uncharacterized protein BU26DRAFT_567596 [Trematosphaeria pertusa]KAF2246095.1 hypothetical protein BU26DRAFT_567596 [Trematosphaeria pertusa]